MVKKYTVIGPQGQTAGYDTLPEAKAHARRHGWQDFDVYLSDTRSHILKVRAA